jgi:protoporphyrinogen oxidase
MNQKIAIIAGAGPAGLTAAYELIHRSDIKPIIFEMSGEYGGLAQTMNYNGNCIDMGGHRFFSKSDRVIKWWLNILPMEHTNEMPQAISYHQQTRILPNAGHKPDSEAGDRVMLLRRRKSRIYFDQHLFDYPIRLSFDTIRKLGIGRSMKIVLSYAGSALHPIPQEENLEEFLINQFGKELYRTFFKSYTEKVWGIPCDRIHADWGRQRIKGLSIRKTIIHALKQMIPFGKKRFLQETETSLIEQFLYPKYGPGQMWKEVARIVREKRGDIYLRHRVIRVEHNGSMITSVTVQDMVTGEKRSMGADYFISTMPIKDLVNMLYPSVSDEIVDVANGLIYRDFIIVGILLRKLSIRDDLAGSDPGKLIPDNWIYVHEPAVKLGRIQIFNNWSPAMVKDPNTVWIGLEYFCSEGDELWSKPDVGISDYAIGEAVQIGILSKSDILDSTIIRVSNAYPAYFGTYDRFNVIRDFVDTIGNLFLVGRNGMHKYNNQDHSMLAAMTAVDNILSGISNKENLWTVNTEREYHEGK